MSDTELMFVDEEDDELQESKFLLFKLGTEEYGVNIAQVQSIEELQKIISVPDMPSYVKGVINLRGQVIPVVDLRIRFGMDPREYDDRTCIIIINASDTVIGFIVDTVSEVHEIAEAKIEPSPHFKANREREEYVLGLGKVGEEVKILLDIEKLIRDEEINALSKKEEEKDV